MNPRHHRSSIQWVIFASVALNVGAQDCPTYVPKPADYNSRIVDCQTSALGDECNVMPQGNYECFGTVACSYNTTLAQYYWEDTVECYLRCDPASNPPPTPLYGGLNVDCSSATSHGNVCSVSPTSPFGKCVTLPQCYNGTYTDTYDCGCSPPNISRIALATVGPCDDNPFTIFGGSCPITADPNYSCIGLYRCLQDLTWDDGVICSKDCDGQHTPPMGSTGYTVDCSGATRDGYQCMVFNSASYSCTGQVVCSNGVYNNSVVCTSSVSTPAPTPAPTPLPTPAPTPEPTPAPTPLPSNKPTDAPTQVPWWGPTLSPPTLVPPTPFPMQLTPVPTPAPTGIGLITCPDPQPIPGGDLICNGTVCRLVPESREKRCRTTMSFTCNPATGKYDGQGACFDACSLMECKEVLTEPCRKWTCWEGQCIVVDRRNDVTCRNSNNVDGVCRAGVCVTQPEETCGQCVYGPDDCWYKQCVSGQCVKMVRAGWDCTTSANGLGVCDANGDCIALIPATTDCSSDPCDPDKFCFDPDGMVNSEYVCKCLPETVEDTSGECVTSSAVCNQMQTAVCEMDYKDCSLVGVLQTPTCVQRTCEFSSCPALPDVCAYVSTFDTDPYDGCPASICEYECISDCDDDGVLYCETKSREEKQPLVCTTYGWTSSPTCVAVPCPTPRCRQPPWGCAYYAELDPRGDVRVDPTGCPIHPCGIQMCWPDCARDSRAACAAMTPRKDCVIDVDGSPLCVEFTCPIVDCSRPTPGCTYTDIPGEQPLDDVGCPLYPCGIPDCSASETCSESQKSFCVLQHKTCVPTVTTTGAASVVCVPKDCPLQRMGCVHTPGCLFASEIELGLDGCPIDTCGKEKCGAIDLCQTMTCTPGLHCKVVAGKPQCVTAGNSDNCANYACPSGTTCMMKDKNTAMCVPLSQVNCGGSCIGAQQCTPILEAGTTTYQCTTPTQCSDECSCSGSPCSVSEQCKVTTAGYECGVKREPAMLDPCGRVACPAGQECVVTGGQTACKEPSYNSQCGTCNAGEHCYQGSCVSVTCAEPCDPGFTCMSTANYVPTCLKEDKCAGFVWPPVDGVCESDMDCPNDMVCPFMDRTSTVGLVSAWCECDSSTGGVWRCADSVLTDRRYCVPRIWDCSDLGAVVDAAQQVDQPHEKIKWCCEVRDVGCSSVNCDDASTPPSTWTIDKAERCCGKTGITGCATSDSGGGYDCTTKEVWSSDKKQYCCDMEGLGCPVDLFDCDAGVAGTWSKLKEEWCCAFRQIGCSRADPIYNCYSTEVFSPEKQQFCCNQEGIRCPVNKPTVSCSANSSSWSVEQRYQCCETTSRGCNPVGAAAGPYDCTELTNIQAVNDWCCVHRGKCETMLNCLVRPGDASDEDACCREQGRWCQYDCSVDPVRQKSMEYSQREYCCIVKGVACGGKNERSVGEPEFEERWRVYYFKFRASWNVIAAGPIKFTRKFIRTLEQAVGEAYPGERTFLLTRVGVLIDGEVPKEGGQVIWIKSDWLDDSYSWDPTGAITSRTATALGNELKLYDELAGNDALYAEVILGSDSDTFSLSHTGLASAISQAAENKGPLATTTHGGTTYLLSPISDTPLTVTKESTESPSSSPIPIWTIFTIVGGILIFGGLIFFAVMTRTRVRTGETSFTDAGPQENIEMLLAPSYNAHNTESGSQNDNKKVIETGNI
eukprot:TRINITY_DN3725_c0_g1_i1.p1 TRINITY_DN3725_c0_g1~~TRINITY_DN3725_c0_g1_i1.p1  ORF type:complete len:1678 (+),score=263.09 TRINITY_DN3725_c0_g1_i1:14-5047(+)